MSDVSNEEVSTSTIKPPVFPLTRQQSLLIMLCCLGLGLLANILLRAPEPGLGLSLFGIALVISLYALDTRSLHAKTSLLLLLLVLLLALLLSWRDSGFLSDLNIMVQLLLLVLIAARASYTQLAKTNLAEVLLNLLQAGIGFISQPFSFLFRAPWQRTEPLKQSTSSVMIAVLRGVILALPLLIVFAVLFSAADARFEALLRPFWRWNIESFVEHGFFTFFFTALIFAYMSQLILSKAWTSTSNKVPAALSLGQIETSLIFGSLLLLFVSFLAVQASYLFGGERLVLSSDLSYANYGRRGFFELVTVTVLLHGVLLIGLWLTQAKRLYQVLASALVLLLYGVVVSAFSRLNLYISTYGLTELRYYSSALILWIAVVMLVFVFSIFSQDAPSLVFSYLILGVLGVFALYLSNPDARIARTNIVRLETGLSLDSDYLYGLSHDAVPAIVAQLDSVSQKDRASLLAILAAFHNDLPDDWRSWNWGQWQSRRLLAQTLPAQDRTMRFNSTVTADESQAPDETTRPDETPRPDESPTSSGWSFDRE